LSIEDFENICESLCQKVADFQFIHNGETIDVTTSIGGCYINCVQSYSIDELIDNADTALYSSKNNGRNMVSIVSDIDAV